MKRVTFERALHMWPEWGKSVAQSRELLGYNPKWKKEKCDSWIEKNYLKIRDQGAAELQRLELPSNLQRYWEDCFYSDYELNDGSIDYSRITRRLSDRKSLPELPYEYGLVWHDGEDIHGPWLPVQIKLHRRFWTKEVFNSAAIMGFETLKFYMSVPYNKVDLHPVTKYIHKAKIQTPTWSQFVIEMWERTKDIDKILRLLYFDAEEQSALEDRLAEIPYKFYKRIEERHFRKQFRDRVYRTLKRAGIIPDHPKSKWWLPDS